jgi:hypothetical protein
MVSSSPFRIRKYENFTSNTKTLTVLIFNLRKQLFAQDLSG